MLFYAFLIFCSFFSFFSSRYSCNRNYYQYIITVGDLAPNVINLRNVRHVRSLVQTEDAQLAMKSVAERSVISNPYNENNSVDDNNNDNNHTNDHNNDDYCNNGTNNSRNNETEGAKRKYSSSSYSLGLRVVVCDVNAGPVAAATLLSLYVLPHMVRACQCYCDSNDKDVRNKKDEMGGGC